MKTRHFGALLLVVFLGFYPVGALAQSGSYYYNCPTAFQNTAGVTCAQVAQPCSIYGSNGLNGQDYGSCDIAGPFGCQAGHVCGSPKYSCSGTSCVSDPTGAFTENTCGGKCENSGGGQAVPTSSAAAPITGGYDCQNNRQSGLSECTYDPNLVNATNNQDPTCGGVCGARNNPNASPNLILNPNPNSCVVNQPLATPFTATYYPGAGGGQTDVTAKSTWTVLDNPNIVSLGAGDFMAFASGTANIQAAYQTFPGQPIRMGTAVLTASDGGPQGIAPGTAANSVILGANKTSGTDPLQGVVLTAVANSIVQTPVNYTFFWNCPQYAGASNPSLAGAIAACGDPSVDGSLGESHRGLNGARALSQSTAAHTYSPAALYTPIVIMESGSASAAESSVVILSVNALRPAQPSSTNNSTSSNNLPFGSTSSQRNGNGGGGNNQFSSPICNLFSADPARIVPPQKSTLSWSCSNTTSCSINGQPVNPRSGSLQVAPTQNATYVLFCQGANGSGSAQQVTTVIVSSPGMRETNP